MSYLIDTNVLLRLSQDAHPMHDAAAGSIRKLLGAREELLIVPQNLIEFWAVATRPIASNGLGLTLKQTAQELTRMKSIFTLRLDTATIFAEWENLVKRHQVAGRQAHDARIVAAMIAHGITNLLTFNTADFRRYTEITVADPKNIATQ